MVLNATFDVIGLGVLFALFLLCELKAVNPADFRGQRKVLDNRNGQLPQLNGLRGLYFSLVCKLLANLL